eukprot:Tamp_33545.p1 GENE.Tamp_33545~~Tamp_33545.p1  ORF type:complete len:199 (-),score=8.19 Tamp_33545:33-569(-)
MTRGGATKHGARAGAYTRWHDEGGAGRRTASAGGGAPGQLTLWRRPGLYPGSPASPAPSRATCTRSTWAKQAAGGRAADTPLSVLALPLLPPPPPLLRPRLPRPISPLHARTHEGTHARTHAHTHTHTHTQGGESWRRGKGAGKAGQKGTGACRRRWRHGAALLLARGRRRRGPLRIL